MKLDKDQSVHQVAETLQRRFDEILFASLLEKNAITKIYLMQKPYNTCKLRELKLVFITIQKAKQTRLQLETAVKEAKYPLQDVQRPSNHSTQARELWSNLGQTNHRSSI